MRCSRPILACLLLTACATTGGGVDGGVDIAPPSEEACIARLQRQEALAGAVKTVLGPMLGSSGNALLSLSLDGARAYDAMRRKCEAA